MKTILILLTLLLATPTVAQDFKFNYKTAKNYDVAFIEGAKAMMRMNKYNSFDMVYETIGLEFKMPAAKRKEWVSNQSISFFFVVSFIQDHPEPAYAVMIQECLMSHIIPVSLIYFDMIAVNACMNDSITTNL